MFPKGKKNTQFLLTQKRKIDKKKKKRFIICSISTKTDEVQYKQNKHSFAKNNRELNMINLQK